MTFHIENLDPGVRWSIARDGELIGDIQRLATGYLVTIETPPKKVKRFRMIDALREALGEDVEIVNGQ